MEATAHISNAGFASIRTVCSITTKSKPTIYRWVKNGLFPAPVRIGPNSVAWRAQDIRAWMDDPSGWPAQGVRHG